MKKILSLVSSAVLALAVAIPAPAQTARKFSPTSGATRTFEQKAVPAASAPKAKFHMATARTIKPGGAIPSLRKASKTAYLASSKKAPLKSLGADASLPNLLGGVIYNNTFTNENQPYGLYSILDGRTEEYFLGPQASYGGVALDGVYYATEGFSFWGMVFVTITAYDLETGEALAEYEGVAENMAIGTAVDPTTGTVYAITYNADVSELQLATIDYTLESATTTAIAPLPGNWNSLVCGPDGQLYGIKYVGEGEGDSFTVVSSTLCKIDKTDGSVTEIGVTGQLPQYLSSATIDSKTGRMFWNVCGPDESGTMCEVNLATGAATQLFRLADDDEIMGMFVAQPLAEAGAPAAVTGLAANFPDGALSGTVDFNAPSTLFDGTAASGALSYEVLANGEVAASGSTSFGAPVSAPVTVAAAGKYTFTVTVKNDAGVSPKTKTSLFVGHGIPAATTATLEYADGNMNLTWEPVTTTIDGGYIDASSVTYTVTRYPDEVVVAENTALTSFSEPIAEPENITSYYYTVVAHGAGVSSAAAQSNTVTLGNIVPPYLNDFSVASSLDVFTILDENADGKKWMWDDGRARMSWNSDLEMDDWMITPPVKLEAGKAYFVSFLASCELSSYPERIEAKWGAAPTVAGMTNDLVAPTVIDVTDGIKLGNYIMPETSGLYYIGIHGISDADTYYLLVDDFSIAEGIAATAPGEATELVIVPDPNGEKKATITFKAPAVDFAGEPLTEPLTKVELSRGDVIVKTFENVAPGAELNHVDLPEEKGSTTYTVQGFNAGGAGMTISATTFIGVDKPAAPANVSIVETANLGEVTITWDAVSADYNGNAINPALVKYLICESGSEGWSPITEELTETTYTVQAVPAGEQDFVQYGVFAVTEGGNSGTPTELIAVGTPYDGIEESFANGELNYAWATGYSEIGGAWGIYTDEDFPDLASQDGDNGYAGMNGNNVDATSAIYSGKIDLADKANPGISFYTYNLAEDDANEIDIYVMETGVAEWTKVSTIVVNTLSDEAGWCIANVSLAAYAGKVIQVRIQATVRVYKYIFIDNVKVGSLLGNDLAARSINAPANVNAGEDYTVSVTVANNGTLDATAFSVELYADGELADTKTVDALAAGKSVAFSFGRNMNAVAEASVEYYAVVKYAADEDDKNNTTATVTVEPKHSKLPAVADLKGENTLDGVKLSWTEPDLSGAGAGDVVDFEDGESFAQEYAGWTFVDVDQSPTGGFEGITLPGMSFGETLVSFFVFDASGEDFNQTFAAHSGDKYLATMFRADDGTLDDWAISPELDGSAQTISFYAKSYSKSYPEKIEMLYSTGSTDPADFVKVSDMDPVSDEWTEYTFDVPAGAKRFAIRSCATGSFILMLDDFTFASATSAPLAIVGYDVYRDGVKITAEPTGETEFIDTEAADGEHTYVVVTVYETGVSKPSNSVVVACSGISDALAGGVKIAAGKGEISITGAEGLNVAISAIDGRIIYSADGKAHTTVSVATGVYIVKAGSKVAKVAVK